jgi:hypothetical protein
MNNRDIQAAWKYHNGTKHSFWSIRNNPHSLDWANRPLPFKIYPKIEPLPLPRDVPQTGVAALSAISEQVPSSGDSVPDLQDIARILHLSAGITKQRKYPGGEIRFGTMSSRRPCARLGVAHGFVVQSDRRRSVHGRAPGIGSPLKLVEVAWTFSPTGVFRDPPGTRF